MVFRSGAANDDGAILGGRTAATPKFDLSRGVGPRSGHPDEQVCNPLVILIFNARIIAWWQPAPMPLPIPLPTPLPLVSVIIPTKDRANLLDVCTRGVLEGTEYENLELIIVDHESIEPETFKLFDRLRLNPRVRIIPYSGEFNYSAMNNKAVKLAKGEFVALLNNDIEVASSDWLKVMVSHAIRKSISFLRAT